MGPLHGMYGSMEAEFGVQRTIKRAELTAFLCLLERVIGPFKVHVDNKGIIDGLRREERMHQTKSWYADLWIKIWEELHSLAARDITVEVAHRTKKEQKELSHFERFVTEGNEKTDDLAKAGATLDEGFMAEARTETMQQEREEVHAALQCAASFYCLVEEWKDCEELNPRPKKSGSS